MALGEYISVSSQRDSERVLLAKESRELQRMPGTELTELTAIYEAKGLSPQTAAQVAEELTAHDALAAHVEAELNIDPEDLANPVASRRGVGRLLHLGCGAAVNCHSAATGGVAGPSDVRRRPARPGAHRGGERPNR